MRLKTGITLLLFALVISMSCTEKKEEPPVSTTVAPSPSTTEAPAPSTTVAPPTTEAPKPENPLLSPHGAEMTRQAPESFRARFETSKGNFVVQVTRSLAPRGVDRFYNLVRHGFYNDCRFFRVIPRFVVQFGINGDPKYSRFWMEARINDDPVKGSNKRGTITFATAGPNSRTTQVFVNYIDNVRLDSMGFAPFGEIVEGMDVLDSLNSEYQDNASKNQDKIQTQGNAYLKSRFPNLDYIKKAVIAK